MTPITTDLAGYAAFWSWWLRRFAVGGLVFAIVVVMLLTLIWRK